ncbi:MAG: sigma-54 interaction domain-containing protein [Candidatus Competibacterales bacterium]
MEPLPDMRAVLDCLPSPAVLLSSDYHILLANQAYIDQYGDGRPLRQRHCYEVSHRYDKPCDLAGESCPLRESLASGQPRRVLHVHHTNHGQEYVDVETYPVRDPRGRVRYLVEIMRCSEVAQQGVTQLGLIGRSPPFTQMLELAERAANSEVTVMLLGESGSGKERVAQLIHRRSPRASKPFVPVECSGLAESLFESELFGHEKGAFTGAHHRKQGLVEAAAGGTLFLDEIGDVSLGLQVKLLRLLETRRFRRVGGTDLQRADFRLICATNRDLEGMVAVGQFRQDLYYRLNVFEIELPPLRQRPGDLPLLLEGLVTQLAPKRKIQIAPETLALLQRYPFPGNVRELRNIVERALLLMDGPLLLPRHLPKRCRQVDADDAPPPRGSASSGSAGAELPELIPLKELERRYLQQVVARYSGDRSSLARELGLSERALYRRLAQLGDTPGG